MLIVQGRDNEMYLFNSLKEAEGSIEAIDVENAEYVNVCDENGLIYKIELLKPPTFFGKGSFKIVPTDKFDSELPKKIIKGYGKKFIDSGKLDEIINQSGSISEALDKVNAFRK